MEIIHFYVHIFHFFFLFEVSNFNYVFEFFFCATARRKHFLLTQTLSAWEGFQLIFGSSEKVLATAGSFDINSKIKKRRNYCEGTSSGGGDGSNETDT